MNEKFKRGFIALSRDLMDSGLWVLPPDHLRVAIWLLLMARHKTTPVRLPDGGTIGRGELATSMSSIAENCSYYENRSHHQMSRKKALKIIETLEEIGFLRRNSHSMGTHITICNYDTYQQLNNYNSHSCETVREHGGNTVGTRWDTYNKGNKGDNGENGKNEKPSAPPPDGDGGGADFLQAPEAGTNPKPSDGEAAATADRAGLAPAVRKPVGYSPDFESWWLAFGRKGSKANAFKRWRELSKRGELPELPMLLEHTKTYLAHLEATERTQKDAEGWLNGKFWESDWTVRKSKAELEQERKEREMFRGYA